MVPLVGGLTMRKTKKERRNTMKPSESFVDDFEKVYDMLQLSKDDFLNSYSYLSEQEYDDTMKSILLRLFGRFTHNENEAED